MAESRLDKLLKLFSSKNILIRKAAVLNCVEFARENWPIFVTKLYERCSNEAAADLTLYNWDGRVCTAETFGKVLEQFCQLLLMRNKRNSDEKFGLIQFDLNKVLEEEGELLESDGRRYRCSKKGASEARVRVAEERARVDQQLSMTPAVDGVGSTAFVDDNDLLARATQADTSSSGNESDQEPSEKKLKIVTERESHLNWLRRSVDHYDFDEYEFLVRFITLLLGDFKSKMWERRHLAGLVLKQIIAKVGTALADDQLNRIFVRTITVLSVDRFHDYVLGRAVAPVREAGAQLAAAVLSLSRGQGTSDFSSFLHQLLRCHASWECRHSGLLICKYAFALGCQLVDVMDLVLTMFVDEAEDVSGAACRTFEVLARSNPDEQQALRPKLADSLLCMLKGVCDEDVAAALLRLFHYNMSYLSEKGKVDDNVLLNISVLLESTGGEARKLAAECLAAVFDTQTLPKSVGERGVLTILKRLFRMTLFDSDFEAARVHCAAAAKVADKLEISTIFPLFGAWLTLLMVVDHDPKIGERKIEIVALLSRYSSPDVSCAGLDLEEKCNASADMRYIGGEEIRSLTVEKIIEVSIQRKFLAANLMALLADKIARHREVLVENQSPFDSLRLLLQLHFDSNSRQQKFAVLILLNEWARLENRQTNGEELAPILGCVNDFLEAYLKKVPVFDETMCDLADLNQNCARFVEFCMGCCQLSDELTAIADVNSAELTCRNAYERASKSLVAVNNTEKLDRLEEMWKLLKTRITCLMPTLQAAGRRLASLAASALVIWSPLLPVGKLNPLIRPLMDCVKSETANIMVDRTAHAIAMLLNRLEQKAPASPSAKIVKNLTQLMCSDHEATPPFKQDSTAIDERILSLPEAPPAEHTAEQLASRQKANNASLVLRVVAGTCHDDELENKFPYLHALFADVASSDSRLGCRLLHILLPTMSAEAAGGILERNRTALGNMLKSASCSARRHAAAGVFASAAAAKNGFGPARVLNAAAGDCLLSALAEPTRDDGARLGAAEWLLALLGSIEESSLVGLVGLLAPPSLAAMSDPLHSVRRAAGRAFASLVRLVPLESDADHCLVEKNLERLDEPIRRRAIDGRHFVQALSRPSSLPSEDTSRLRLEESGLHLRTYQLEGVGWLRFLDRYSLHGILCDDMGLGKTLQTLCGLALARMSCTDPSTGGPSLIVCPATLTSHWLTEINGRFRDDVLKGAVCLPRGGNTMSRLDEKGVHVFITSYDALRRCNSLFAQNPWDYVVLDEGHVVRNAKSQLFAAVKALRSRRRLILTGTPVQNGVGELWTLFEFLMPGYLGSWTEFSRRFLRPVVASRDPKAGAAETQAGQRALEALHKQVLPFCLRRLKGDVLEDLPPKVVQERLCTLTTLQRTLYERCVEELRSSLAKTSPVEKKRRMSPLGALMYLRQLCDHPSLVDPSETKQLEMSGKMVALKELLNECGIGRAPLEAPLETGCVEGGTQEGGESSGERHRALIFCQFKSVVSLLCRYLSEGGFGEGVTWLRLDGSVPVMARQAIVDRFNNDPSIDLLLLTTQVGGLGLNLVGADVVIFVDMDYNPARDLQAVDRAHRIGQRRSVNVYRLVCEATLEENILRLQRLKTHASRVVIGEDNGSVLSMASDELLDLLALSNPSSREQDFDVGQGRKRRRNVGQQQEELVDVAELWQHTDYEAAFDVDAFISDFARSSRPSS